MPVFAVLGILLFLNTAKARYPRPEQMEEVKRYASLLQQDTGFLVTVAKDQRTQYNDVEQKVVDDLQDLAMSAAHFNAQINKEFANPEHTEADYTRLKSSYAKASADFPIIRENDVIRVAMKRVRDTMTSLTGFYEAVATAPAVIPPSSDAKISAPSPEPAAPETPTTRVTWTSEQYKSARDWSNKLREDTTYLYTYAQKQRGQKESAFDDKELERLKILSERTARFQEQLKAGDVPPERSFPEYREIITTYSEIAPKFSSIPEDEKMRITIERSQKTFSEFNNYYGAFGKLPEVGKTTKTSTTTKTTTIEERR
jgi:hypothetical protein